MDDGEVILEHTSADSSDADLSVGSIIPSELSNELLQMYCLFCPRPLVNSDILLPSGSFPESYQPWLSLSISSSPISTPILSTVYILAARHHYPKTVSIFESILPKL